MSQNKQKVKQIMGAYHRDLESTLLKDHFYLS